MKILVCTNEAPPMIGGAGQYIGGVIEVLVDDLGFDVTVLAPCGAEFAAPRAKVREVKPFAGLGLLGQIRMLLSIDFASFDTIIVNDLSYALLFALAGTHSIKARIVYIAHGLEPELLTVDERPLYRLLGFRRRYLRFLRAIRRSIFVSVDLRQKFAEYLGHERADDTVCRTFLAPPAGDPVPPVANLETWVRRPFVLTASRIVREKGFDRMWQVMRPVLERNAELIWVVAGDGPYRAAFEALIAMEGGAGRVAVIGARRRDGLNVLYASCRAFLLLSEYRESLGLVYVEARSFGAPCLGNDYGGVREALPDGVTVEREAPAGAVAEILETMVKTAPVESTPRSYRDLDGFTRAAFADRLRDALKSATAGS